MNLGTNFENNVLDSKVQYFNRHWWFEVEELRFDRITNNEDSAEYNNILQRHLTFLPNPKYIPNNYSLVQSNVRTCISCVCIQTVYFQSPQKKGVLIWLNNLNKSESCNTLGVWCWNYYFITLRKFIFYNVKPIAN